MFSRWYPVVARRFKPTLPTNARLELVRRLPDRLQPGQWIADHDNWNDVVVSQVGKSQGTVFANPGHVGMLPHAIIPAEFGTIAVESDLVVEVVGHEAREEVGSCVLETHDLDV